MSLQAQVLRTQRLESIGMLATGIAHDLNNILCPILMGVSLIRERMTDEHDLRRVWEPFFTTKSQDKGTGLGLATTRGIVEGHHGFITLESTPQRGTTFRIYLPAATPADQRQGDGKMAVAGSGQGELILLVDDEDLIRKTAAATLTRANYRVMTASDGIEATAIFSRHAGAIQLVLTDLDMPKRNGLALVRAIRSVNPAMKVLVMSGLASGAENMRDEAEQLADAFIAKPFDAESLLRATAALLTNPRPAKNPDAARPHPGD